MLTPDAEIGRAMLDRATAYVPASVPLTRVLLGADTACALRDLVRHGCYDLLIIRDGFMARNRAVRREIRRLGLCTLRVDAAAPAMEGRRTGARASAHSASGLV
jgi:hypothetical protein